MAQRTILVDDIDGTEHSDATPVSQTVIAVHGRTYALDLTAPNRRKLDEALAPFLRAATPVHGREGREHSPGYRSREARERARAVRVWAAENGHQLNEKGRIPREIDEMYTRATSGR